MVNTPVLFITFCRPDYARKTWEGIKAAQPSKLYFYSNKGRENNEGEIQRNDEIRAYVNEIDWSCDLHTWFRDECVNVYDSLKGAIDWLFENEERGIVLEEDCVPTLAFFSYIDQLIDEFENDTRIWCISGDNYLERNPNNNDYFFSHYHWMFGWATWRRVWKSIKWDEASIRTALKKVNYCKLYKTYKQVLYKKIETRQVKKLMIEKGCWDYLFGLSCDVNSGLTICPREQLISNVGISGTHHNSQKFDTVNKPATIIETSYSIKKVPKEIIADKEFDRRTFFSVDYSPLRLRIYRTLKRFFKRLFNHKR